MNKRTIQSALCCAAFILCAGFAHAQASIERDVIGAAGDHFTSPTFSLSWTLGEPVSETISNDDVMLTQGFHQGEFKLTAVKEPLAGQFDITVFPNPTPDVLNIRFNSGMDEIITVQLYSMSGEKILFEKTQDKNIQLNLAALSSASYLLSLRKLDGSLITTYVINKTR